MEINKHINPLTVLEKARLHLNKMHELMSIRRLSLLSGNEYIATNKKNSNICLGRKNWINNIFATADRETIEIGPDTLISAGI